VSSKTGILQRAARLTRKEKLAKIDKLLQAREDAVAAIEKAGTIGESRFYDRRNQISFRRPERAATAASANLTEEVRPHHVIRHTGPRSAAEFAALCR
jgi:hypothetical protein